MRILYIFSVVGWLLINCLQATIIYVPSQHPTIQDGINAASNFDTVLVDTGRYVENINFNGKNIVVGSLFLTTGNTFYISRTVIDGNSSGSVVTFENSEDSTAVLTGFTITNGFSDNGGGICCDGTSPTLMNLNVIRNIADLRGGGILCRYNSNPIIENVTVRYNKAWRGGGIYCDSEPRLSGVNITKNSAFSGGGIRISEGSVPIFDDQDRCNIYLNHGADLYTSGDSLINVVVDTFTVLNPTNYVAYPLDKFTFDILNAKIVPIEADLYVSPTGDDDNSGLTPADPLLTIFRAFVTMSADSLHLHTIYLANGVYSPSVTEEFFPILPRSYVSLSGQSETGVILDAEGTGQVLASAYVHGITVENLTATNAVGAYGGGITCEESSLNFRNMIISYNTAYWFGGGIACHKSILSLENVSITGNFAGKSGGGIDCEKSTMNLKNVTINDNTTLEHGGGIDCSHNSTVNMVNVKINKNTASKKGGGIRFREGNTTLSHVAITGNSALSGGGIYCSDSSFHSLTNVTISNNMSGSGGGIYCDTSSIISSNTIIWHNSPDGILVLGDSVNTFYSDIQGGWPGIGNIDADPIFVDTANGDFTLQSASPCIDSGTAFFVFGGDTLLNLNPWQYNDTAPDMGAYEYGPPLKIAELPSNPKQFKLFQNFPNPFNPSTKIRFDLQKASKVKIEIFNILGQRMETLLDDNILAGTHEIEFTAENLPSGIYYYRIQVGDPSANSGQGFQQVRKMSLMK